jgi:hypothetical protein
MAEEPALSVDKVFIDAHRHCVDLRDTVDAWRLLSDVLVGGVIYAADQA